MEKPELSLVCPAYHDEKNIGPLVKRCIDVLRPVCRALEIIVVEDGSPDGTGRAADELAGEFPEVTALHHEKNQGHGAALKTGMRAAKMPMIALMDGDGQYEPLDLPPMLAALEDAGLVQGRRVVYPNGRGRFFLSLMYNAVIRWIFRAPYRDLGCSIKVMKREVIEKCVPEGTGIFMQGELILRARLAGFRIVESDVMCYPRRTGRSHSLDMKNLFRMVAEVLSFMVKSRRGTRLK